MERAPAFLSYPALCLSALHDCYSAALLTSVRHLLLSRGPALMAELARLQMLLVQSRRDVAGGAATLRSTASEAALVALKASDARASHEALHRHGSLLIERIDELDAHIVWLGKRRKGKRRKESTVSRQLAQTLCEKAGIDGSAIASLCTPQDGTQLDAVGWDRVSGMSSGSRKTAIHLAARVMTAAARSLNRAQSAHQAASEACTERSRETEHTAAGSRPREAARD